MQYADKILNEFFPDAPSVPIEHIYIDLTYQRVTDIHRCGVNIIDQDGFNDYEAGPINLFKRAENKYVCADGGHRIIMAILVGKEKIRADVFVHNMDMSLEEMRVIEADFFVSKNSRQDKASWEQLWKAGTIRGDELDLEFLAILTAAKLDIECSVRDGATYEKGKRLYDQLIMQKNQFIREEVPEYCGTFEAEDLIFTSNLIIESLNMVTVGEDKGTMLTKDLEPLARLHYAVRTDSLPLGIEMVDFVATVKDWYANNKIGKLTEGRKSNGFRAIVEDYITYGRLFDLDRKQKNKLKTLWRLDNV